MTIENSPEKKLVERTIERINVNMYSTKKTKPTIREMHEGYDAKVRYQVDVLAPETQEILKKRRFEEEEKVRKFRDESNVTKVGEKNIISSVEKMIQNEQMFLHLIYEHPKLGSIPSPLDKPRKHVSKKKGWGPFENMKRADYAKRVHDILSMSEENRINLTLADAEVIDRRNRAILRNKRKTA